jgi:hypothetical protein
LLIHLTMTHRAVPLRYGTGFLEQYNIGRHLIGEVNGS